MSQNPAIPDSAQDKPWNKIFDAGAYCARVMFAGGITAEALKGRVERLESSVHKEQQDKTDLYRRVGEIEAQHKYLASALQTVHTSLLQCSTRLLNLEQKVGIPVQAVALELPPEPGQKRRRNPRKH